MSVDKIRAKTVGAAKSFKSEVVSVAGVEIEVRQMSLLSRKKLFEKSSLASTPGGVDGGIDVMEWQIWGVIESCFDPESGEKVYDDADYESFLGQPSGGFVDELSAASARLNLVDVEELAKNSEGVQNAS